MGWSDVLVLTEQAKSELKFWLTGLDGFNSQPVWHHPSALRVVYSNASDTGYGGYTVEHGRTWFVVSGVERRQKQAQLLES